MTGYRLGTWIDTPPGKTLKRSSMALMNELPFDHVSPMVDGSSPGLQDQRWFERHLEKLRDGLRDDIEIGPTVWVEPVREYIERLAVMLPVLCRIVCAAFVCADSEMRWKKRYVRGYDSLEEAGLHLSEVLYSSAPIVEGTAFPKHRESSANATIAVDRYMEQVYSIHTHPSGRKIKASSKRYGPGHYQRWALQELKAERPDVEIGAGLACWRQKFAGMNPADAMALAHGAAIAEGATWLREWSWKHILGNSYPARFLRELAPSQRHWLMAYHQSA